MSADEAARGTVRVLALSSALVTLAAVLYLTMGSPWDSGADIGIPWWALLVMFALADALYIHFELRGDAQTFSLNDLPMVLALFFATPADLVIGRVLGGLLVIVLIDKQTPLKRLFNTSLQLANTCITLWLFHGVMSSFGGGGGAETWVAIFLALIAATLVDTVAISTAIRMTGSEVRLTQVRKLAALGVFGAVVTASLALLAVSALQQTPFAALLLLVVVGALYGVFRGYANLSQRHAKLQQLYEFTQALTESPELGSATRAILEEARALLRSARAELCLSTGEGRGFMRITLDAAGELRTGLQPEDASDPAFMAAMRGGCSVLIPRDAKDPDDLASLQAHDAKDLLMVPLLKGSRVVGTITMLDRLGDMRTFDEDDLQGLGAFANHATMALENARLIDALRKEAEDRQHQALHDSLTGLANRSHFLASTVEALARTRHGGHTCVMLMDLDRFKDVNDTLGHHHGDLLIREVAARLVSVAPPRALVARLGGDEFAILLPAVDSAAEAVETAERIHEVFGESFNVEGVELSADGSIGVAISPEHGATPEELLQRADVAMYVAKDAEQLSVMVYEEEQNEHSARRLQLAGALRTSIAGGELDVCYQPKASLVTGAVIGVEALARWVHPTLGRIGPDEFIPLAEHVGLMRQLTMLVLDKALAQLRSWHDAGLPLDLAVNLSVRNLLDAKLPLDVQALLERHDIDPARLTLEITESEVMRDPERSTLILGRLQDLGVDLSIDDFGTGHSSLAYLKTLPVDEVKIDRAFVGQVAEDEIDSTIIRSIVDVARNRGLRVVAEGIEDRATWDVLRELGCDVGQGYYLCRPEVPEALTSWLHARQEQPERAGTLEPALER
jgi:diguanylate cyclase (GGDEF)-like protein